MNFAKPMLRAATLLLLLCISPTSLAWTRNYELIVDGERRGHASIRFDAQRGLYQQRQLLEVVQLQKISKVTREVDIRRLPDGRLTSIKLIERAGLQRRAWRGSVRADVLHWRAAHGKQGAQKLRWDGSLLLVDDQLRLLHGLRAAGQKIQARSFDPTIGAWRHWHAELIRAESDRRDYRIVESGQMPDDTQEIQLNDDGQLVAQTVRRFGLSIQWRSCVSDCQRAVLTPLDVLSMQSVRSPFHIPRDALGGPIRYVLSRTDGQIPELESTPEQEVIADGQRVVVTICDACGADQALSDSRRKHYLSANAWVRSDDIRVRRFARRAGSQAVPADLRMRKLEMLVAEHLPTIDMLGYKDAVTALESGSGDCTETAVVLAAAARAQGIPARIVAGLVYSDRYSGRRDVFAPHYWVQAWVDGRWTSYDAGVLGFDATHIALGVGDGDPNQTVARTAQLGRLRIEKMGLLPPKPSVDL